ncbi:DUF1178 family protein [Sphingomonas oligophenolica]|uniref:DUF1178 family protein n=1 Tax=Sphingomonas oligophenolica TaxID=301154 RepID=A0A502CJQ7_9SPHN|nr:DUF1178 family protein [Sphingomonas oligophenolica]TPG12820.1 DUF1178 family protein [Sphingomonas oligophenolica]
MIVFDLRCGAAHVFEAWFASSAAYDAQRSESRIACPVCGDTMIDKAVMAPAIGAKSNGMADRPPAAAIKAALKHLAAAQARSLEGSQWVGDTFANRARAMHDGDEPAAPIHGKATVADAKALVDDGVPIAPLPLPIVPPDTAH